MARRLTVTLNTDASFCPDTKAGGYAFWISSDLGRVRMHGKLKRVKTNIDAELQAIANGLYCLVNHIYYEGIKFDKIYINSDCVPALGIIKNSKKEKGAVKFIKSYLQSLLKNKRGLELRHVKAHTNNKNARSFVNNWCDEKAKQDMKIQREIIKKLSYSLI